MLVLLIAALFSIQGTTTATIDGMWDVALGSPGGPVSFRLSLKLEGEKLVAAFVGPNGNDRPLDAKLEGRSITLSFNTPPEFGEILVTMRGTVQDDVINGKADYAGFSEHDWSAERVR